MLREERARSFRADIASREEDERKTDANQLRKRNKSLTSI